VKNVRALSLATATLVLATVAAGTAIAANAVAPKTVAFKGSYTGTVVEKVDGQTVTANTNGAGSGTLVGKSKLFGVVSGTTASPPCSPLNGPGTIAGPAGKLRLTVVPATSHGCAASEEDQTNITVSGNAKVTGGTLKFRKARGTLHFSGHYDRTSGAFDVKLTGKLTY
jgi:hypothetical protein